MENATNGLIMAGSIFVAVIVLSLFTYMFLSVGNVTKNFQDEIDSNSIQKFNKQFEQYVGRDDLTPYDVLTVYNLAESINDYYGEIIVMVIGFNPTQNISEFLSSGFTYKCGEGNVKYNEKTQKIYSITFQKNT